MANSNHLQGWQWRESKSALDKKERAKVKHFESNLTDTNLAVAKASFIIPAEMIDNQACGIVAGLSLGKIKVLLRGTFYDCLIDQGLPIELGELLAVGDYVTIKASDDKHYIDHLIERKTVLSRLRRDSTRRAGANIKNEQVIAANINMAIIVVAAKNPPLHPKFIDRYLILIQHCRIKPLICVNKSDLEVDNEHILAAYRNISLQIVAVSTKTGQGLSELKQIISRQTVVLVGNSGVGKSSLINALTPDLALRTGEVSVKTGRGRHTTTASDLIVWDEESYIIDTPGIRSLEVANIAQSELELYFSEIRQFSPNCQFADCLHNAESQCAVKEAVDNGLISRPRYESYLKILKSLS